MNRPLLPLWLFFGLIIVLLTGCNMIDGPAKPPTTNEEDIALNKAANKLAPLVFKGHKLENAEGWQIIPLPADGTGYNYLHVVGPGSAQGHVNGDWFRARGGAMVVSSGNETHLHGIISQSSITQLMEMFISGKMTGHPVLFKDGGQVSFCKRDDNKGKELNAKIVNK